MSELPPGWTLATGADLFEFVTSGSRGWAQHYSEDGAAFIRIGNLDHGTIALDLNEIQRVQPPKGAEGERTHLRANDILISITAELGMIALVPATLQDAYINQHIALARPRDGSDPRYIAWYLASEADGKRQLLEFRRGATKAGLGLDDIRQVEIRLAPVPEQKRIADKLDSLLARVNTCRERLDRVPGILKRFRQAVLAAATSGELTREWRGESKEHLLEQTPRTWSRCLIKEAGRVQLGRQRSPKYHSGSNMRPYLRVQNVFEDRIDLSDVMEMDFPGEDFERYKLHPGDILLNEGQSPEFLGRPALYKGELPGACFTNTLIRFQAHEFVSPNFALLVFRHYMHAGRFSSEGTITTNIAHLGAGRFGNIEFPLPSLAEQAEIVRRATSLLSFADHCENDVKRGRSAADRLTPSLLSKAFRGELVPQDPNDEPASISLSRLQSGQHLPARKVRRVTAQSELKVQISAKKGTAMISRQDVSASHLSNILKERGPLGAEALWSASELEIDDFYEQLKDEEAQGLLTEKRGDRAESVRMLEFVG